MRSDNGAELFPVVDEAGNVMGAATRAQCHGGGMLLHPVVHLHLFNSRGELYLQRRPVWKDIQPGRWDTAVGGHVDYGETVDDALRREVREELGVTGFVPERVAVYVFRSERERELIYVHRTTGRSSRATSSTAGVSGAGTKSLKISAKASSRPISRARWNWYSGYSFFSYIVTWKPTMKRLSCMSQGIVQHRPVRGAGIGAVPQTHVLW